MITYETKIEIDQPSNIVFDNLMDMDKSKQWMTGLEDIKITEGKLGEVGSKLQLTFNEKGKRIIFDEQLVHIKPNESFGLKLENKQVSMTSEVHLKNFKSNTELLMINGVQGKGLMMKLILPFFKKAMIKKQTNDLQNLKQMIEK